MGGGANVVHLLDPENSCGGTAPQAPLLCRHCNSTFIQNSCKEITSKSSQIDMIFFRIVFIAVFLLLGTCEVALLVFLWFFFSFRSEIDFYCGIIKLPLSPLSFSLRGCWYAEGILLGLGGRELKFWQHLQ